VLIILFPRLHPVDGVHEYSMGAMRRRASSGSPITWKPSRAGASWKRSRGRFTSPCWLSRPRPPSDRGGPGVRAGVPGRGAPDRLLIAHDGYARIHRADLANDVPSATRRSQLPPEPGAYPSQPWIFSTRSVVPTLAIVETWQWHVRDAHRARCLAALPVEPYEAALIDGASRLQTIRYVTIPLVWRTSWWHSCCERSTP